MPTFGGYAPFPLRFGESVPTSQWLSKALASARGTALDSTEGESPVWVENVAIARAIADVWDTNERMGLQTDLSRTTMLSRWEKLFGIVPSPTQEDVQRRAALVRKQTLSSRSAQYQAILDLLNQALAPITFQLIVNSSSGTGVISSSPTSWRVSQDSSSSPACTMSGVVTGPTAVEVVILAAGSRGVATYSMTVITATGPTYFVGTTAASVTVAATGLTWAFGAGTYASGAFYSARASDLGGTFTSVAELTILTNPPASMSDAIYYQMVAQVPALIDPILPSYASFHVARDGSAKGSFVLDDTVPNLDNQRLSG